MDLTSKVNRLLAEFAGRIGLPSLSLDEEGMATAIGTVSICISASTS